MNLGYIPELDYSQHQKMQFQQRVYLPVPNARAVHQIKDISEIKRSPGSRNN